MRTSLPNYLENPSNSFLATSGPQLAPASRNHLGKRQMIVYRKKDTGRPVSDHLLMEVDWLQTLKTGCFGPVLQPILPVLKAFVGYGTFLTARWR